MAACLAVPNAVVSHRAAACLWRLDGVAPVGVEITAVAERMVQHRIHRLIIARDGVMVGLVSTIDLLKAFAQHRRAVTAPRASLQRA